MPTRGRPQSRVSVSTGYGPGVPLVAGGRQSFAHPVVTGGTLYLRYDDNLYAYDVRGPGYESAHVMGQATQPTE